MKIHDHGLEKSVFKGLNNPNHNPSSSLLGVEVDYKIYVKIKV